MLAREKNPIFFASGMVSCTLNEPDSLGYGKINVWGASIPAVSASCELLVGALCFGLHIYIRNIHFSSSSRESTSSESTFSYNQLTVMGEDRCDV